QCKSLECLRDQKITNASYAVQMLASTGHPHSLNFHELSMTWAGDHKLCLSIEGPYDTNYCFVHVSVDWSAIDFEKFGFKISQLPGGHIPNFDMGQASSGDRCTAMALSNVKVGLCMPASCEKDTNIGRILSEATNDTAHLCDISCVGPTAEPSSFFYLFNVVFISLIVIAVAASVLDYLAMRNGLENELKNKTAWKIVTSFSIIRNSSSLFAVGSKSDSINCLDAIRFITFTWVVNGHCDLFTADGDNGFQMLRAPEQFINDILLNAYASVDTFFLVSGLLVSYTFFKRVHSNPEYVYAPYNWIILTPSYMLFIAFFVAWTPQLHDVWATGVAQNSTMFVENCEKYWWLNALYINNFRNVLDICYGPSWFLAVDTQLYWAAPLFLIAIFYSWMDSFNYISGKTGLGTAIGGILFSVGATIFLTALYDLPALGFTVQATGNLDFMTYLYIKPWIRCIPYITGIVCGYFIVQVRKQTIKIRQPKTWELALCWFLASASALTVIFSAYDYLRGASDWSVPVRALYGSFARIGWSASVAWVILACTFDWAGPVKWLLEHPFWYPLGRLSFCAFLAHWFVLHILLNSGDGPAHFVSLWHTYATLTIPIVVLSYGLAYVWSCLVEIPFGKIEGISFDMYSIDNKSLPTFSIFHIARSEMNSQGQKPKDAGRVTTIEVDNHH
ncbi:hypothetical protein PENTCL1PPCAC_29888, partial [Pristionchus entomophagus]